MQISGEENTTQAATDGFINVVHIKTLGKTNISVQNVCSSLSKFLYIALLHIYLNVLFKCLFIVI